MIFKKLMTNIIIKIDNRFFMFFIIFFFENNKLSYHFARYDKNRSPQNK